MDDYYEVATKYFDATIERALRTKYPDMVSWRFNGKAPQWRPQARIISFVVKTVAKTDCEHIISMYIDRLFDVQATSKELALYIEEKCDDSKVFVTKLLQQIAEAGTDVASIEKDVSKLSEEELEKTKGILTDEGFRIFYDEDRKVLKIFIEKV